MIRSTLFKSVAPALRGSLNDAEVCALGMWLLMSAGAYPRAVAMFAKGGANTEELEAVTTAKYVYPEGTPQEELLTGGMTNPDYRLPVANRMTAANVIAGLEDLMYTIATSNEERNNPHRNDEAPPMPEPEPVPDVAPQWPARPFQGRPIPPVRMEEIHTFNVQAGQVTLDRVAEVVDRAAVAMQARIANEDHHRQARDLLRMREEAEQRARLDALANRTRGIPNRR